MKYQKVCFKYRLAEDYTATTKILDCEYEDQYVKITKDGVITGKKGFAWDGCSSIAIDDETNMVPGLLHDIKYYLMRIGAVPQSWRYVADKELQDGCRQRGMGKFRAWYYLQGVDHFAAYAAKYGSEPKIIEVK